MLMKVLRSSSPGFLPESNLIRKCAHPPREGERHGGVVVVVVVVVEKWRDTRDGERVQRNEKEVYRCMVIHSQKIEKRKYEQLE